MSVLGFGLHEALPHPAVFKWGPAAHVTPVGPQPQQEASSQANWGRGRLISSALQSDSCDPKTSEALDPTRLTWLLTPSLEGRKWSRIPAAWKKRTLIYLLPPPSCFPYVTGFNPPISSVKYEPHFLCEKAEARRGAGIHPRFPSVNRDAVDLAHGGL